MIRFAPPKRFSARDLANEYLPIFLFGITTALILVNLFPRKRAPINWLVVAFPLIIELVRQMLAKRALEVIFDSNSREVIIFYKSLLTKIHQHRISYNTARIEFSKSRSRKDILSNYKIYFLKNKMEVFEITVKKDKFDKEELLRIVDNARNEGLPTTEI